MMSCRSKALLCLLQRTVRAAPITLPKLNTIILSGGRRFPQHRSLSSAVRGDGVRSVFETQSVLKSSCLHFCTKSSEEYPPLPEYQCEPELQNKEVYIIQVRGLPWSCTAQDLLQFFSECRIRDGLKGIHLTTNPVSGRPSGQAFIEVEHEDDVSKALEKHRQYLGPRYVEVFEVTNADAEAILRNAVGGASSDYVVRLRGLPFSSSEEDITNFFSGLDIVQNGITIVIDHQGRNSGHAFVEFTSQEAFEEALRRDRELIGHRYIEVFPSQKNEIRTGWKSRTTSSLPQQMSPPGTSSVRQNSDQNVSHLRSHYVHMRGLPFNASGEDIVKFFFPLIVSKVLIEFGSDGRPSGEADVYFSCHQEAVAAMSRDKMHIGERYIELFLNSESDSNGR